MFTFRLEPLITLRDNELKECQKKLANAYSVRRALEENLQDIDKQLAEGMNTVRNLMQTGQKINARYLLGFRQQEMFLRFEHGKLTQQIEEVDKKIELFRAEVIEANKELKIVEKLKEKRHEKYLEDEKGQETKTMNEISGNRRTQRRV